MIDDGARGRSFRSMGVLILEDDKTMTQNRSKTQTDQNSVVPRQSVNLVTRILSTKDSMPEGERAIAEYVLQHQSAVAGMPQADLARACGISPSTVTRFCKRIGEPDYRSLQIEFVRNVSALHGLDRGGRKGEISIDDITGSLHTLLRERTQDLTTVVDSLPVDGMKRLVSAILDCRLLEIAATGRTIPVALDAAYKFERAGILTSTSQYYEKLLSTAILLSSSDVLIIISRSGWSGVLQQIAHAAHDHGALVAVITANSESPMTAIADIVLLASSNDGDIDGTNGNSRIAESFIVEAIYALVWAAKPDASQYLKEHEHYVLSNVDLP